MPDAKPAGYPGVMPYLIVADPAAAIEFYINGLGGTERLRLTGPGGAVMHAEIALGEGVVMLAGEFPDQGRRGPAAFGGTPVLADGLRRRLRRRLPPGRGRGGEAALRQPADTFYGDRAARFADPAGHVWTLSTHIEDGVPGGDAAAAGRGRRLKRTRRPVTPTRRVREESTGAARNPRPAGSPRVGPRASLTLRVGPSFRRAWHSP